jgi:hypothetical protein
MSGILFAKLGMAGKFSVATSSVCSDSENESTRYSTPVASVFVNAKYAVRIAIIMSTKMFIAVV